MTITGGTASRSVPRPARASTLPPAGRAARWLWPYFGAWGAVALMYIAVITPFELYHSGAGAALEGTLYSLLSWSVRALVLLPGVWLAGRFPLSRASWKTPLLAHLGAGTALASAKAAIVWWIALQTIWADKHGLAGYFAGDFPFNLLSYAGVVGAAHGVAYYRRFREREIAAARLEAELARAELDALTMQLHPHFLFNTLHSISALIHEDPDAADVMVSRLSDYLRMVLENAGTHEVELSDELHFLDLYLTIQKTRFRERLRTTVRVDAALKGARVPNLILQPLVENAIRHAVEPRSRGGHVEVHATREDGLLRLRVCDDGPGLAPTGGAPGRGVGLANTRTRLRRLYGDAHSLHLAEQPGGGLCVHLSLPYSGDAPHG